MARAGGQLIQRRSRARKAPAKEGVFDGYAEGEDRPLPGYALMAGIYAAGLSLTLLAARKRRGEFPRRIGVADIVLMGMATHRLSRLFSKDRVMSPVRAPFTRMEKAEGSGELTERSRGRHMRKAIGDLVTCPYCLGTWVGTGLLSSFLFWPRLTRILVSIFSAVTISDLLHDVHFSAKEKRRR